MGQQELCRDDGVVEDVEVTAEVVAGAQLRQRQMHLVHTETQKRETRAMEDKVFRKCEDVLTVASAQFCLF